jgi:hypothetical protein
MLDRNRAFGIESRNSCGVVRQWRANAGLLRLVHLHRRKLLSDKGKIEPLLQGSNYDCCGFEEIRYQLIGGSLFGSAVPEASTASYLVFALVVFAAGCGRRAMQPRPSHASRQPEDVTFDQLSAMSLIADRSPAGEAAIKRWSDRFTDFASPVAQWKKSKAQCIAGLRAVHNLDFSRTRRHSEQPMTAEQRAAVPPVDQPIVRISIPDANVFISAIMPNRSSAWVQRRPCADR